jgi:hypothetical protein
MAPFCRENVRCTRPLASFCTSGITLTPFIVTEPIFTSRPEVDDESDSLSDDVDEDDELHSSLRRKPIGFIISVARPPEFNTMPVPPPDTDPMPREIVTGFEDFAKVFFSGFLMDGDGLELLFFGICDILCGKNLVRKNLRATFTLMTEEKDIEINRGREIPEFSISGQINDGKNRAHCGAVCLSMTAAIFFFVYGAVLLSEDNWKLGSVSIGFGLVFLAVSVAICRIFIFPMGGLG